MLMAASATSCGEQCDERLQRQKALLAQLMGAGRWRVMAGGVLLCSGSSSSSSMQQLLWLDARGVVAALLGVAVHVQPAASLLLLVLLLLLLLLLLQAVPVHQLCAGLPGVCICASEGRVLCLPPCLAAPCWHAPHLWGVQLATHPGR
jgi:hypothetical protein